MKNFASTSKSLRNLLSLYLLLMAIMIYFVSKKKLSVGWAPNTTVLATNEWWIFFHSSDQNSKKLSKNSLITRFFEAGIFWDPSFIVKLSMIFWHFSLGKNIFFLIVQRLRLWYRWENFWNYMYTCRVTVLYKKFENKETSRAKKLCQF